MERPRHFDVEQVVPAEAALIGPGRGVGRDVGQHHGSSIQPLALEDGTPRDRALPRQQLAQLPLLPVRRLAGQKAAHERRLLAERAQHDHLVGAELLQLGLEGREQGGQFATLRHGRHVEAAGSVVGHPVARMIEGAPQLAADRAGRGLLPSRRARGVCSPSVRSAHIRRDSTSRVWP